MVLYFHKKILFYRISTFTFDRRTFQGFPCFPINNVATSTRINYHFQHNFTFRNSYVWTVLVVVACKDTKCIIIIFFGLFITRTVNLNLSHFSWLFLLILLLSMYFYCLRLTPALKVIKFLAFSALFTSCRTIIKCPDSPQLKQTTLSFLCLWKLSFL